MFKTALTILLALFAHSLFAQEQQIFIVSGDTLTIAKLDMAEYAVVWKGDTVVRAWSFSPAEEIASSMGAFGYMRSFLLQAYQGDGCPVLFQVLVITEDNKCVVTDYFGNCEEIRQMKCNWPEMHLFFDANKALKRNGYIVTIDMRTGKMVERKR